MRRTSTAAGIARLPLRSRPRPARILILPLLLVLGLLATSCGDDLATEPLGGIVRTPTPLVGDLSLPNTSDGSDYFLKAEPGQILVAYFGYTACPDVCPTTMSDVSAALKDLGDDAEQIDVVMITIDPDRDTDRILSGYVNGFVEGGQGLRTTDPIELREVADRLGANYSVETTDEGVIEVGHTAFLYAINEEGELVVSWAFGTPASELTQDFSILLARMKA